MIDELLDSLAALTAFYEMLETKDPLAGSCLPTATVAATTAASIIQSLWNLLKEREALVLDQIHPGIADMPADSDFMVTHDKTIVPIKGYDLLNEHQRMFKRAAILWLNLPGFLRLQVLSKTRANNGHSRAMIDWREEYEPLIIVLYSFLFGPDKAKPNATRPAWGCKSRR